MKRKGWMILLSTIVAATTVLSGCSSKSNEAEGSDSSAGGNKEKKYKIVMVAKHEGISWFDDMRTGVDEFDKEYADVDASQIAPEGGDPAKQVQMVEDLIAQGVDAILVVPNDPTAMAPVLKKAKEKGIVVVSHEAEGLADIVDYDLEAFNNDDFGVAMFEAMAKSMNYEGKFTGFVGALTMQTHMQWYNAGLKYVTEKYPKMEFVSKQPYEDRNDEKIAYEKAQEVLKAYPDIKGIFNTSVSSGASSSLVLQEKNNKNVHVTGIGLPSVSGNYLKEGFMYQALCWRPADAGYAAALVAYKILKGEEIKSGIDLKRPGYESVTLEGKVLKAKATLILNKDNVDDYPF
ncbi:ABC transporter substrate-binding protein [Paenibacillus baekrokdamisoli]|uniref:ABC transporter substrate-binding protein n=1 Tax=Paenibacillus baekrokdamisoli TaxID=1712516 RepID=A0A3G9IZZ3_9BACL|nr:autoinducer 2 ABC transporter substrate-binding protein [Paenibacillus baekrokdamisoli]MBB3071479.1 simple sugar transport system substrate-binding protein [Paenibacillus baekrokdamisoli]BBH24490.1 ABC transporter substrate-binding protein [Paenibacillus baekrokdamisoli]